jgi:hypothetical protein
MMTQREHVYGLAAANNIKVNELPIEWGDASANSLTREVNVPRLDYDEAYAAALHELGHLIAPGGNLRDGSVRPQSAIQSLGYTLHEEATAWDWAKATALAWTPAMQKVLTEAFETYRKPHADAKETEALEFVAKCLPRTSYKKGDAAAFFTKGRDFTKRQATRRLPTTDLNKTPLTPEAIAFKEFKKMIESLFGGSL